MKHQHPNEWHNTYHLLTDTERLTLYRQALDHIATRQRRWYQSPLVQLTTVLLVVATGVSLVFIQTEGIPQLVLMLWGSYVVALDMLIIHRTVKKLVKTTF